jgi:hypothetical protein
MKMSFNKLANRNGQAQAAGRDCFIQLEESYTQSQSKALDNDDDDEISTVKLLIKTSRFLDWTCLNALDTLAESKPTYHGNYK